ncbi:uncharacterized protein LOC133462479 [Cololabis saira]|uniref:uncharacterized protein LOC133462479 n=1 Tax=Cololabis saira TaxID=129043 RepID=UPI002AD31B54|nr:uncharacterized protein LOC133462479 [Cololabis saira]
MCTQLGVRTLRTQFRSKCIQTDIPPEASQFLPSTGSTPMKPPAKRPRLELEEEEEEDIFAPIPGARAMEVDDDESSFDLQQSQSSQAAVDADDPSYNPADSLAEMSASADTLVAEGLPHHKEKKYIIYRSCLMELFKECPLCQRPSQVSSKTRGTMLIVEQTCTYCAQKVRTWRSQPMIRSMPAGNIQLSSAIYIAGESFSKFERVFNEMNVAIHKYRTFRRHTKNYVEPAIVYAWKQSQNDLLAQCQSSPNGIIAGGDMRADSPGHSAKYGSYTMMNLAVDKVIDVQLVQSNQVGGSNLMEKQGLADSLAFLEQKDVTVKCIVTDRHPQIQKYLKDNGISQYYDVWHLEKSISKQLEKIAKTKNCEELRPWIRSIRNHIYWTASSSSTGPEREAKWKAILNHVRNIHVHQNSPLFEKCLHPIRDTTQWSKWLKAGSSAFHKLEKVLENKRILKDVMKLSPHHQTSSLEAFHAVIIRFAPKSVAYTYIGMLCRTLLAVLHFNENSRRPQAKNKKGEPMHAVRFPKARKGECRAVPVLVDPTFRYAGDLMDLIFEKVIEDPAPYTTELMEIPVPEDLCAEYERPDREDVIARYVSRFNSEHDV